MSLPPVRYSSLKKKRKERERERERERETERERQRQRQRQRDRDRETERRNAHVLRTDPNASKRGGEGRRKPTGVDVVNELGAALLVGDHGPDAAVSDIDRRSALEGLDVEDAEETVVAARNQEIADQRQFDDPLRVEVERHQKVLAETAVKRVVDTEDVDLVASVWVYFLGGYVVLEWGGKIFFVLCSC